MRTVALALALLIGCNKKGPPQAPAASGALAAGSAVVAPAMDTAAGDAAIPDVAVPDAAVLDAAAAVPDAPGAAAAPGVASAKIMITANGLSSMPSYKRTGKPETEVIADIQARLAALPGLEVSFAVMEYADEHEEGYFSVKQGEEEVAQLFRTEDGGVDVRVFGAMFPTPDGVRTGDKAAGLVARYPDLVCEAHDGSELGLLQCRSRKAAGLVFILDATKYKGKRRGKLDVTKLGDRPIFMIAAGVGG